MEQIQLNGVDELIDVAPSDEQGRLQVIVCTSFVIEPIQEYTEFWSQELGLTVDLVCTPYNQVFQQLLDPQSLLNQCKGINCVLIRVEDWIKDKGGELLGAQMDFLDQTCLELMEALEYARRRTKVPFMIGIVPLSGLRSNETRITAHIATLNKKLEQFVKNIPSFHLLDLQKIATLYDVAEMFDSWSDQIGHMPFTKEYYAALGTFIIRKIRAYIGPTFKVIALDCDNTLWKGVCGEVGSTNVIVDHNYTGLQEFLLEKYNEGFLLVLCSKNNEDDVWEVFDRHKGMKLKRDHIAAHRINWSPKAANLLSMAKQLNVGVESFVFLDDSRFEVEQVLSTCPKISSLCLPEDADAFYGFLHHIWELDSFFITDEDRQRNILYKAEKERKEEQVNYTHLHEFLQSLNIQTCLYFLKEQDLDRAWQLTLRTNQFNLNGIRKTREDLWTALDDKEALNWIVKVSDRFGDYGVVGLVLARKVEKALAVDTFLLSCRVLGRNVEDFVLSQLQAYCASQNLETIIAHYQQTQRNAPFKQFLTRTGWTTDSQPNTYKLTVRTNTQDIAATNEGERTA